VFLPPLCLYLSAPASLCMPPPSLYLTIYHPPHQPSNHHWPLPRSSHNSYMNAKWVKLCTEHRQSATRHVIPVKRMCVQVRCAFFDHNLALEDAIEFHAFCFLRLKRCHACDQWHSSRVSAASYRSHRPLRLTMNSATALMTSHCLFPFTP
jgi:hypothetical protein